MASTTTTRKIGIFIDLAPPHLSSYIELSDANDCYHIYITILKVPKFIAGSCGACVCVCVLDVRTDLI